MRKHCWKSLRLFISEYVGAAIRQIKVWRYCMMRDTALIAKELVRGQGPTVQMITRQQARPRIRLIVA